jgi:hypothetical protein
MKGRLKEQPGQKDIEQEIFGKMRGFKSVKKP